MDKYARYLRIVRWAAKRYRDPDGFIITYNGIIPSRYIIIENMAARKILGITL